MALTDEEKLSASKEAFFKKLNNITTWTQMKNLVDNITSEQVKTFLKNNISSSADQYGTDSTEFSTKETDLDALAEEYNSGWT